jgi:Aerotolerance regulator N-terminal/von Willebrand factor type A domain
VGFFAPWFLAGAALIGLPLWIHLLRQYRSTPHPFSSLMFFEQRTQSSIKHRRLRYLLLLSLRIALLILLALAFANPFVSRTAASTGTRKMLVIAVDNSFSMRYGNHLDRAKQVATSAVSNLNGGERGQVLSLGSRVHFMTQAVEDPDALKAAIQSIQPSDERSSYAELARALRTIQQSARIPLEVHLVSDMQKSSLPPAFADLRLGLDTNLIFHSVADSKEPNWLVESVTAPARIFDPKKVRVQAVIANTGSSEKAQRTVSLVLDGKVLESKPVEVPPNGRVTAEFLSLESPHGFHKAEIRIEPQDSLHQDDRFAFAIERADPHPVLFLHPAGDDRDELYYRAALESVPEAGFVLEPLAVDQAANQAFSKYAFVVLSNVGAMPTGLENSLRAYVQAGGSLLVVLGPGSAALPHVPVSNETIQGSSYASRDGDRFQVVANADAEHPALRRTNKLDGVQFYQVIRVDPGQSRVVARLTNQLPLLLEKQVGEGRVLVFTSTFDRISNDLPLHASFVPFVEESARYLGGQQQQSANVSVDSYVELRSAKDQGSSVEVIDPDGQRPLSLKEATSAVSYQVNREGYYEIHRANGRQELVAVHADRRESDLTPISQETLDLWRNTGRGSETPGAPGASDNQARPWSLWRYALLLVLLTAIIESVIASRYLSVEKEAA